MSQLQVMTPEFPLKAIIHKRLGLPAAMPILLLLALLYRGLENLPHEIFGTVLFAPFGWHIAVNRAWFTNLFWGRYDTRRTFTLALHLLQITNVAVLLVASIVISKSALEFLPVSDSIYLRDVHWFAAYWVMIIVGAHVGLHWTRVMAMARTTLRLTPWNPARALALRAAACSRPPSDCGVASFWAYGTS
ncbi:DUF4405 domain-containing protein [Microvirga tunisiensis]|uniref:DUF4405 domain-containing protein n=1 Tax=Microvirga tunisiensis TaxID=2108360 RepID=UPI001FCEC564|nr:DUF4405 domain-containing protein [Microvirga tunisiensis]